MNHPNLLPYQEGNILSLSTQNTCPTQLPTNFNVKILKVMEPITLSIVLKVEILDVETSLHSRTAILKLFDRRINGSLRERDYRYERIDPWDPDHDSAFYELLQSSEGLKFGERDSDGSFQFPKDDWTIPQKEVWLHETYLQLYKTELEAYKTMMPLQGTDIPELYADICLSEPNCLDPKFLVKGLLMEFIDGFIIRDIEHHVPEEEWKGVIDGAIAIVIRMDDFNILNKDLRLDNVLVKRIQFKGTEEVSYKPVLIDFALTEQRGNAPDDQWTQRKCQASEEASIGGLMQQRLTKRTGKKKNRKEVLRYIWEPSGRYVSTYDGYSGPLGYFLEENIDAYVI